MPTVQIWLLLFIYFYYLDLSFSTPFNSTSTLFWKLLKWRKKVWLLCLLQLHLMLSILNFQIPHRGKVMNKRHLFDYGFITVVTCMIVQNAGQIASKHFQSGASVALPRSHLEAWDQKVHLQSQKKIIVVFSTAECHLEFFIPFPPALIRKLRVAQ